MHAAISDGLKMKVGGGRWGGGGLPKNVKPRKYFRITVKALKFSKNRQEIFPLYAHITTLYAADDCLLIVHENQNKEK